jgi:hypothetical protein
MKFLFNLVLLLLIAMIEILPAQGCYTPDNIGAGYISRQVNVPDKPVVTIGVSETRDAAALFFQMYESYIKASDDGVVNFTDLQYLVGPAMLLIPAFSGAPQILNELAALTDDQVKTLLLVADEYELGEHAQRAKQVFKTILTLAQTYFVFVNAQGE